MTNSTDPDQLASSEANWSGSTLFAKSGCDVFSMRRVKLSAITFLSFMDGLTIHTTLVLRVVHWNMSQRKTYNMTCVTSKDSDQSVYPPSKARVLVHPSLDSQEAVEGTCDQRRLWSDCVDAQADLSLRWSHKSRCRVYRACMCACVRWLNYIFVKH